MKWTPEAFFVGRLKAYFKVVVTSFLMSYFWCQFSRAKANEKVKKIMIFPRGFFRPASGVQLNVTIIQ